MLEVGLVTCLERADLLALVGDVYCIFVTFPCGVLGRVCCLIVPFPDLCDLSYFDQIHISVLKRQIMTRMSLMNTARMMDSGQTLFDV